MKTFIYHSLSLILSLGAISAQAQTKKTIASGNWNNPAVWSPSGVPTSTSPSDSVIVNHPLTFTATLDTRNTATQAFVINPGGALNGAGTYDTLVLGMTQSIVNRGAISVRTLALGDVTISTINMGQIQVTSSMACSDVFYNHQFIDAGQLMTSSNFYNQATAIIVCDSLISSDNLTNNGDISTGYWINEGNVTGSTGRFCVTGCFMNVGDINGSVDICDTPSGFCDIQAGTIAPTVTYCAAGPCQTTTPVNEILQPNINFNLYPNPSTGTLTLDGDFDHATLYILNTAGETVMTIAPVSSNTTINLGTLERGVYLVQMENDQIHCIRRVILF